MNPALSVIFFTTLSGAGFGMLAWVGLSVLLMHLRATASPELQRLQVAVLLVGMALAVVGLLCSLAHLGKPERAWRAFSQWRTSWLSREGVASLATLAFAAALLLVLWPARGADTSTAAAVLGVPLLVGAAASVVCTAMIYASLRPIPAWRHPLVVPAYLLFALATGLGLQFVVMSLMLGGQDSAPMLLTLAVLGVLLAALKWLYWYEIDQPQKIPTRGDAIGLPDRRATVFERPHTEASFVTQEMAFSLARRHGTRLRIVATLLFAVGPMLALLLSGPVPATAAVALAAVSMLAGAFVERWLFFAQARHLVTLYY